MCASLQSAGTEPEDREDLKRAVSAGAISLASSFSTRGRMPSRPQALCGFRFCSNVVTPRSEISVSSMVGKSQSCMPVFCMIWYSERDCSTNKGIEKDLVHVFGFECYGMWNVNIEMCWGCWLFLTWLHLLVTVLCLQLWSSFWLVILWQG